MVFSALTQIAASAAPGRCRRRAAQLHEVGNRRGDGTFERCRAGEPGTLWYLTIHHQVQPADLMTGAFQGPKDTSGIAAPAGGVACPHVIRDSKVVPLA